MIKYAFLLPCVMGLALHVSARQTAKKPIDASVFGKWPSVRNPTISNNGEYVSYTVDNQPAGSHTLVLQAIKSNWKIEWLGVSNALFSDDSRQAIFMSQDTLYILTVGTSSFEYIRNISSFRLVQRKAEEYLAYQLNNTTRDLIIRNMQSGKQNIFPNVTSYTFSANGQSLLLQLESKKDSTISQSLNCFVFPFEHSTFIWTSALNNGGTSASNFIFDTAGKQLAFLATKNVSNNPTQSIWHYKAGAEKAVQLADDHSSGIDSNLQISGLSNFSKDGSRIFFMLKVKEYPRPQPNTVKVDIWSYTDAKLQSQQLQEVTPPKSMREMILFGERHNRKAIINIVTRRIFCLQQEDEMLSSFEDKTDDFIFILSGKGDVAAEWNWNSAAAPEYYLIFTKNGEKKRVPMYITGPSQDGQYAIGQKLNGRGSSDYFSYEIATGITRNITQKLPIPAFDDEYDYPGPKSRGLYNIAGWLENDEAILIYDKYDIWQVDPRGQQPPVSLTNSYGRKHNMVFRLAERYDKKNIPPGSRLIVSAFNRNNKNNGFYSIRLDKKQDPEPLTVGPYLYTVQMGPVAFGADNPPIKARDTNIYLIHRQTASHSPNLFYTQDFRNFQQISFVFPEKTFNWLTTELMNWKNSQGKSMQGILYKPENFDPQKKYPVIIHFYEKKSDRLHEYKRPDAFGSEINIPWFVSNGYLVFTPDIDYTIGEPGQSALNAVIAAAKHLSGFPWVNSTRMGIQGHSFGGYETNYIVTHSNSFAAAVSASGSADFVSGYGSLWGRGTSLQGFYETGQPRIGATLWEMPDLYIKNSPLFQADKVTTPLLMMNNKEDGAVAFSQGIEFFTALRRLGKKSWMLQYDGEAHTIGSKKAALDYTIRVTQFFDHYLKDVLAPKWMTRGIPASLKGIDNGYELDHEMKTPGTGLLIQQEKKNQHIIQHKNQVAIKP